MLNIQAFESGCQFYDAVHFPHGFNRAGVFTRTEAEILSRCGFTIKQLSDYSKEPESEEQQRMLTVIHGEAEAESMVERTWIKYLQHIQNRGLMRVYGLSSGDTGDSEYSEDSSW